MDYVKNGLLTEYCKYDIFKIQIFKRINMVGTYLMFNGNCKEALKFYEKAFNVKIEDIQKYEDIPPNPNFPVSDDIKERILHSRFVLDGTEIMCADSSAIFIIHFLYNFIHFFVFNSIIIPI